MTKEEFMIPFEECRDRLYKQYGGFLYFLANDILNIGHAENICEEAGFTTERKGEFGNVYSEIKFDDVVIGSIYLRGFPCIEFHNRKRKFARKLESHPEVIAPIEGVHGVLQWHTVKGKLHCLAGGQTVLHLIPLNISDDKMVEFLTKTKLIDKVDEFKSKEEESLKKLKNDK